MKEYCKTNPFRMLKTPKKSDAFVFSFKIPKKPVYKHIDKHIFVPTTLQNFKVNSYTPKPQQNNISFQNMYSTFKTSPQPTSYQPIQRLSQHDNHNNTSLLSQPDLYEDFSLSELLEGALPYATCLTRNY